MGKCISVIVPIYNSSKTLDRCIKSILRQEYTNLEILLINDGSVDDSESICKTYAQQDKRINYIYKKNSGAGDTRNYGINIATGDYIGFVDSDDEVLPDMYKKMINANKDEKYDIIGCSNYDTKDSGGFNIKRHLELNPGLQEKETIINDILYQTPNAWGAVWNKIFKKKVFEKIRFPETSIMEDYFVTLRAFNEFSVYYIDEPLYIHYTNNNSLSHRTFKEEMLKGYDTIHSISKYFSRKNSPKSILIGCDYLELSLSEFICRSIWRDNNYKNDWLIKKLKLQEKKKKLLKYKKLSAIKLYMRIKIYYLFTILRKVKLHEK